MLLEELVTTEDPKGGSSISSWKTNKPKGKSCSIIRRQRTNPSKSNEQHRLKGPGILLNPKATNMKRTNIHQAVQLWILQPWSWWRLKQWGPGSQLWALGVLDDPWRFLLTKQGSVSLWQLVSAPAHHFPFHTDITSSEECVSDYFCSDQKDCFLFLKLVSLIQHSY